MRLLYFASTDFYARPNPSYHLMLTMMKDILAEGHQIHLVGCSKEGVDKHIPDDLEAYAAFSYDLVSVPNVDKSDFVRRYLSGVHYAIRAYKTLRKALPDCNIVFVQSSPTAFYNLMVVRHLAKRKKIIYNVQDMFPGSSIASGVMPRKWMQNIFYWLQRMAYKKADIITAISDDMKEKLMEQGVPSGKIWVIVNWFDDQSVREADWAGNRFVRENKMEPKKFYVQYAGTMGYVFDYKMVIGVARELEEYPDIEFQMVGEGSQKQRFMNEVKDLGLNNITFLPLQPQEMVSDVYSACSVCFIPLKEGIIGNSVPSKAGLLMACRRPIITSADRDSHYCRMINNNRIGIAVPAGDVGGAVNAILRMYKDENLRKAYADNGYEFGRITYSRKHNMDKYLRLFEELNRVN